MEYRELGRTNLRVSRLGFGGAPIGISNYLKRELRARATRDFKLRSRDDRESESFQAGAVEELQEAVARGITYFDTAPGYGSGRSERLIGEALSDCRDKITLATKFVFDEGKDHETYTRDLQESLARLRTDHVDILQAHGNIWDDTLAEKLLACRVLDWLDTMRRRGLVRFAGITAEGPSGGLERLLATGRLEVVEIAYSVIYQATCDYQREPAGIIPLARSLGVGVTVMRPTTCGVLQKLLSASFPEIDRDRLTELAINFALSTPEVDCVVVGMRSEREVLANVMLEADARRRVDLRWLHNRFED
jgi:hypothetical protein